MPETPYFVALDLELNQPSNRIIQVGVALGHPSQSEEEWTVCQWLISPDEPIAPTIVALTGITDARIASDAVPLAQVAKELGELLGPRVFVNPVTWGGGDSKELLDLFAEAKVDFPYFGRRWLDVKTMHTMIALAKRGSGKGGLSSVMARYKLAFIGEPHRADTDAFNTLRLFFRLLERQQTFEALPALLAKNIC